MSTTVLQYPQFIQTLLRCPSSLNYIWHAFASNRISSELPEWKECALTLNFQDGYGWIAADGTSKDNQHRPHQTVQTDWPEPLTDHCKHMSNKRYNTPQCCSMWETDGTAPLTAVASPRHNVQHESKWPWIMRTCTERIFIHSSSKRLRILKILQMEVEGLLAVQQSIVDRKLDPPTIAMPKFPKCRHQILLHV